MLLLPDLSVSWLSTRTQCGTSLSTSLITVILLLLLQLHKVNQPGTCLECNSIVARASNHLVLVMTALRKCVEGRRWPGYYVN